MAIYKLAPMDEIESGDTIELVRQHGDVDTLNILESWLLSTRQGYESELISGKEAGMSLNEFIRKKGMGVLGTDAQDFDRFPITVKQVNTLNPGAVRFNPDKKHESLWVVLDAKPGACVYYGMSRSVTLDEVKEANEKGTLKDLLQSVEAQPGDVFTMEAGTLYAFGAGLSMLEVEKMADQDEVSVEVFYRSVNLEPLHAAHHQGEWVRNGHAQAQTLGVNDVFGADAYQLNGSIDLSADDKSFKALFFISGSAVIDDDDQTLHAEPGNPFFVEAGSKPFAVTGNCEFILVHLM